MRDFIQVAKKVAEMSKDDSLTANLTKVAEDAAFTAPEFRWQIRGEQIGMALQQFAQEHNDTAREDWFLDILVEWSDNTKTKEECIALVDSLAESTDEGSNG